MPLSFQRIYNSKTKFLQSYIDSILSYNKRGDFVRDVWLRAWRFWETLESKRVSRENVDDDWRIHKEIHFDRVRKHLDAHFTDEEMAIILAEKERLTNLRRTEKRAIKDGLHQKEIIRQRIKKVRFLEIRVMREMGYSFKKIEQELGLSRARIENLLIVEGMKKKNNEIDYLLGVLEVVQEVLEKR